MSLRDRVPVPPLSDQRWQRLERRIAAGAAARAPVPGAGWGPRLALAVVVVGAVVLAVALRRRGAVDPAVVGSSVAVTAGAGGDRVDLGDAILELGPAAVVRVDRGGRGDGGGGDRITIALGVGAVHFEVAPRGERPPFVVRAADVTVTVVGTAFTVERTDRVRVAVEHGRVRVEHQGHTRFLDAGQAWSSPPGLVAAAAVTAGPVAVGPVTASPAAGTATPGAPPAAAVGLQADAPADPSRAVSGIRTDGGRGHDGGPPARTADRDHRHPAAGAAAAVATGADELAGVSLAPILALDATEPAEMVRRYATIVAAADSRRAAHALYSMAWVQYFRLAQPERAVQILEAYDRRFPRGGEADSATWLRLRILCATRRDDACRAAAHTFVARFPGDPRAELAERLIHRAD